MSCPQVTIRELKQKLFAYDDVQIVDVREIDEYREGHIEGATLIPLGILPYRLEEVDRNKEVVLVCRSGNRSSQACELLRERGFYNVRSLQGGLSSWTA
ncbi:rhodanese-like domain-containing protein [Alicyclobacillus ferrooxydans]|nr:rhodanese-like domain-containing protein [Alicyclobacillus ferrooxydans]